MNSRAATSIDEKDENLIFTKSLYRRRSKGPIMFNGCSPCGNVIIVENICKKKTFDLSGWSIERQTDSHPMISFTFPSNFVLGPSTSVELWSRKATPIPPCSTFNDQQITLVKKVELSTWNRAENWSISRLFDATGREKAIFLHRTLTPTINEINRIRKPWNFLSFFQTKPKENPRHLFEMNQSTFISWFIFVCFHKINEFFSLRKNFSRIIFEWNFNALQRA